MSVSTMLCLLVTMNLLGMAVSSPRERVMVKYKVKDGVKGEKVEVMDISDKDEALNTIETGEVFTEDTKVDDYKKKATVLMRQLKKAARARDL